MHRPSGCGLVFEQDALIVQIREWLNDSFLVSLKHTRAALLVASERFAVVQPGLSEIRGVAL